MEKRKRDNYLPDGDPLSSGRTREVYGGGKKEKDARHKENLERREEPKKNILVDRDVKILIFS